MYECRGRVGVCSEAKQARQRVSTVLQPSRVGGASVSLVRSS
jgi:hypothetical protein